MNNFKKGVMVMLCQMAALCLYSQVKLGKHQLDTRWTKISDDRLPLKEHPNPQFKRSGWGNLNGLWEYAIIEKNSSKDQGGKILVPYPIESFMSGVGQKLSPTQTLCYKKKFNKPTTNKGKRILLHFGAVDCEATVVLNGLDIGTHSGGYTEFSFDITDELKQGQNELVVKVQDLSDSGLNPHGKQTLDPKNIYYTSSSGIWQTVWLEVVPEKFISGLTITPDIDKSVIKVTVKSAHNADVSLEVAGKKIKGKSNTQIIVPIRNPRLWSPDDPYLYDLTVTLGKDKVYSYFGMRKVAIQKDEKGVDRIFLNNKPYFNLGTLDQGFWPDGLYTAPTDEALAFDIKAIKAMGFNTIRKHIKVEPARWYYHADKIGVLVWQDFVNPNQGLPEGAKQAFEKEVKETLTQLHNHPSIITWVVFNERWGAYDQKRIADWVKATDPTRLVNAHSGEYLYVDNKLREDSKEPYVGSDMTDVHSYPDPRDPMTIAGKAKVIGEFGGIGVSVPGHQWDDLKGWGYVQVQPKDLADKYAGMISKLKVLKDAGLSGSIYTQPFDVEGEENGLMTYDREIIKIPLTRLREMHGQLIDLSTKGFALDKQFIIGKDLDVKDTDDRFAELYDVYKNGQVDSATLRRLTLMVMRKKDFTKVLELANAYKKTWKQPAFAENLKFDKAVLDFLTPEIKAKINPVLLSKEVTSNTGELEKEIVEKYGEYGEQVFWDVEALSRYLAKDISSWLKIKNKLNMKYPEFTSVFILNNDAWFLFENSLDRAALETALLWSKKAVEKEPTANYYDTYANLLYKLGRKDEAIEIEEKALTLEPGNGSIEDVKKALEKMRAGLPTWPTQEKQ
ncbi:glycoside hydrolase family 2 protein [Pedobacter faecalis]|uniref:glycoside hydrolase family 2 protein n=1 Tax=Pedobacter faecalis TaxID=3041495 RepID=UPI002549CB8C|nr:sugar-binding domain-containing protein [Pedobacter sp. ELA7]